MVAPALLLDQALFDSSVTEKTNEQIHRLRKSTRDTTIGIIGHSPSVHLPELMYRRLCQQNASVHLVSDGWSSYSRLQDDSSKCEYRHTISQSECWKIEMAIRVALMEIGSSGWTDPWWERFQQYDTMVQCDVLGENAPQSANALWDPDGSRQERLLTLVQRMIPDYTLQTRWHGKFDITRWWVDVWYGINRLKSVIQREWEDVIYMCPPENERIDDIRKKSGVRTLSISSLSEALENIQNWLLTAA